MNEELWLFSYGSLLMKELYVSLLNTVQIDFSTYLCGHSNHEYQKEKVYAHIHNIEHIKMDESTRQNTIGLETYRSSYKDKRGSSDIVFTSDKVNIFAIYI